MRTYLILFLLFSFNINADELDVFFEALNKNYLFNEIVYENELAIQKSNGEIIKKMNQLEVHIKQPFEESYYVSETEIEKVNNYLRSQAEPDYIDEILNFADEKELSGEASSLGDKDELYQAALDIIRSEGKASTSFLQRKLQIGYNRAARIVDMMEADGIVSKANHVGKRDVL